MRMAEATAGARSAASEGATTIAAASPRGLALAIIQDARRERMRVGILFYP